MKVLIGDSDEETHYTIRRAVLGELPCEMTKAHTGPDVLDKLQREHADALILDAHLPILDAAEVVQILRESPRFASLPIFIVTSGMGQALARRLLDFGIMDILVKPFPQARLDRLTQCLKEIANNRPRPPRPISRLTKGSAALIVDGDKAFREYFTKAVDERLTVTAIESGAKALELCHRSQVDVVFLGTDLGLVDRAQIARRLRTLPYGAIRIVAIPQKSDVQADRASGLFDDVMLRTYAPAAFEQELARWLRNTTPFERLSALIPDIRIQIVRAVEQAFGTMLGTDVEPVQDPVPTVEAHATASVTITPPPSALTLRVRFGMQSGRQIAAAFMEMDADSVADEDIPAVAGEVANILGGRIKVALQERQLETVMGLPVLAIEPEGPDKAAIPPEQGADVHFRAIDRPVAFRIQLTVEQAEGGDAVDEESGVTTIRADAA